LIVVGVDDGYFPPIYKEVRGARTILAAVSFDNRLPVRAVLEPVTVDGRDGTNACVRAVKRIGSVEYVILDSVIVAGFNIIDPWNVNESLGVPVIVFFRHPLNLEKIRAALNKHFDDARERFSVIGKAFLLSRPLPSPWGPKHVLPIGTDLASATYIIRYYQLTSPIPLPVYAADAVASGVTRSGPLLRVLNQPS
jgi:endonuclease V-like protein UPF0215 family